MCAGTTAAAHQTHTNRSTTRRGLAPLIVAAGGVAGLALVSAVDPRASGAYPRCPLHAMTGLWCPGCGITRALHDALHGDLASALSTNAMLPVYAVLTVLGWWSWWQIAHGRAAPRIITSARPTAWIALGATLVTFAVLRNLPVEPFAALAP
jgi:hypothetical protein